MRFLRALLVFALAAGALAAVPVVARAATSGDISQLTSTGGYNSVRLTWVLPKDRTDYLGVTIWRYEGNRSDNPPRTLVATLGASRRSYVDTGLSVPSTQVWGYSVFTRDAAQGPIDPQSTATFMTSAVSGRVTDAQGNGVQDVDVYVGPGTFSSVGTARTAADGTWQIDGIAPSSAVNVCFDPSAATGGSSTTGYQSQCYRNVPSVVGYGPSGQSAALPIGVRTSGIDATLQPGGVVAGVIRDRQGRALAHAGVTVRRQDGEVGRNAVTGADGGFAFSGLMPGAYAVCGYQSFAGGDITPTSPKGYLATCSDGTVEGQPQGYFTVAAGANVRSVVALAPGGAITGRLVGPDGSPLVGVTPVLGGTFSSGARLVRTDADGDYQATGLRTGSYTICFNGSGSRGSGDTFDPGLAPRCWQNADPASPTSIAVTAGHVTRGVGVRQFANPTVAGRVTDAAGTPLANAFVYIDGYGSAATDPDGRYRVGVTPGTHTVCFDASAVRGPSPSGYVDQCWDAQPRGGTSTPVTVVRGAQLTGIDATLAIAAGVRATVVDAHDVPLRNADVALYGPNGGGSSGFTDASGVVTFTRVYLGAGSRYTAIVDTGDSWNISPQALHGYVQVQKNVTLHTGMVTVKLVVASYGTLAGTVYGPDGQRMQDAFVSVHGSSSVASYSTDADGTYAIPQIAPGNYTVCFTGRFDDAGTNRAVSGCFDHATTAAPTPVVVPDAGEVTGIDGHLAFT